MAAYGRSNEDQTSKINEEVGSHCRIMVHLSHATWLHLRHSMSLSEIDGRDIKILIILYIDILSYINVSFD